MEASAASAEEGEEEEEELFSAVAICLDEKAETAAEHTGHTEAATADSMQELQKLWLHAVEKEAGSSKH